ncbi:hypothetical protein FIV42_23455 [Persicimonas caeni]|uniref:Tyrosine specific protein phosphatases domain-containing protein n=1 Tax=Persicimonas caeni TaxID=2292766 RepID=A0A4Y6PZ48_PERCE|nr:hypothetical protein [Persicimonas caeni]QDG53591.1 hypothetical protein FIV42_23455 [Persicimonas caeni]QED34812.1 hypothetical protein FRD00_23450 [Persicimonas caeni]
MNVPRHPKIMARSLPEANMEVIRLGPNTAVVSIGSPDGPLPYGFEEDNPLHLRLEFHDVLNPDPGAYDDTDAEIRPPKREDVELIRRHAESLRQAGVVYCHCNAGISRSTAVAYILRCIWRGPGCEEECLQAVFDDRPEAEPNELLVRYADEMLRRGGRMLTALSAR